MTKRYLRKLFAEYSTLDQRSDCLECQSQEIIDALIAFEREEMRFHRRLYRNRAYFSLDCDDGIERTTLTHIADPYDAFEQKLMRRQIYAALVALPDKQAQRIYAHFFLGKSKTESARAEGIHERAVRVAIARGLRKLRSVLEKHQE